MRDFIVGFECHEVTVRGGQEGELVAGTSLVTRVDLVIWAGCSSLFVGMLRRQENRRFLQFTVQCYLDPSLSHMPHGIH